MKYLKFVVILISSFIFLNAVAMPPNNDLQQTRIQSLSKENTAKGVNDGSLCTDEENLAYTIGSIIKKNNKNYRCVRTLGENLVPNVKLSWIEIKIINDEIFLEK